VSSGVRHGPTRLPAVATSRKLSGAPSNPATWPNAYRSVCRLPQLWFWLPGQPSTSTRRSPAVSVPVKRTSGAGTRLLAGGKPPR
jgi:hypothetical protein